MQVVSINFSAWGSERRHWIENVGVGIVYTLNPEGVFRRGSGEVGRDIRRRRCMHSGRRENSGAGVRWG